MTIFIPLENLALVIKTKGEYFPKSICSYLLLHKHKVSPFSTMTLEFPFLSCHPAWYICHGAILQLFSRTFSEMAWSPIRCRWMGLTKYQFFGKKYIFRLGKLLEIMEKKRTNKNISSFSHLNFGIGPQMLMGWEYFCTYLSLKQGKSTSCFQNVRSKLKLMGYYNPIQSIRDAFKNVLAEFVR